MGVGCLAASPLILVEVPHHHPWHHKEHGGSWRDGDEVVEGTWGHLGTQGDTGMGSPQPRRRKAGRQRSPEKAANTRSLWRKSPSANSHP